MSFSQIENERCRLDFPALERQHAGAPIAYLDGPAGSQIPRQVLDAMVGYYHHSNANWHGCFPTARDSDQALDAARDSLATFLGAESGHQISIGQNMTTLTFSLSTALARRLSPGDEIVITALDHEANRGPWMGLSRQGVVVKEVSLLADGTLDHEDFARQVTDRTRLVAVGMASNALGTVNDMAFARRLATGVGAWLLVDAVHSAPHFPIDVKALDVDFLLCSAYKFYGPHVGILYSRPGLLEELETDRLIVQSLAAPGRIETGTLNHAAIVGAGAAVDYIASWGEGGDLRTRIVDAASAIARYEHEVGRRYFDGARSIPGVTVWGPDFSEEPRAPTVSVTVDGLTAEEVACKLGDKGIQVWDGHFYAVRAVEVLGLAERGGLVRTGVLMYNTESEIDRLLTALEEIAGA